MGDKCSEIVAVKGGRGGQRVEDKFSVLSTEVVQDLVGPFNSHGGSLCLRPSNTAVMLVPPFDFRFRTQRQPEGSERSWPTELIVTGHFLCLVDRGPLKSPVWSFDDARALYTSTNKHAYKIAVAHAMHALGEGLVMERMLEFLELLLVD